MEKGNAVQPGASHFNASQVTCHFQHAWRNKEKSNSRIIIKNLTIDNNVKTLN